MKFAAIITKPRRGLPGWLPPVCCAVWILWLAGAPAVARADRPQDEDGQGKLVRIGSMENRQLEELSGLAFSKRSRDILWAINDGGHGAVVYAAAVDGTDLASIRIGRARNVDWEDLASFSYADKHYLMIADVGDNNHTRSEYSLYVVEEPAPRKIRARRVQELPVAWQIDFRYEDGPRDCEAIAVDSAEEKIYLLSKSLFSSRLYELPLVSSPRQPVQVARALGRIPRFSLVTAMDIAADSTTALVLTYQHPYLLERNAGESWASGLQSPPRQLRAPALFQAEAACFDFQADSVYISSEGSPAPLVRIFLPDLHQR
jgi:hypothetical protein